MTSPDTPPTQVTIEGEVADGWHPALVEGAQWWKCYRDGSTEIQVTSHNLIPTSAVTDGSAAQLLALLLRGDVPRRFTLIVAFTIEGSTYDDRLELEPDDAGRAFIPLEDAWLVRATRAPQGKWSPLEPAFAYELGIGPEPAPPIALEEPVEDQLPTPVNRDLWNVAECNQYAREHGTHNPWDAMCVKVNIPGEPTDPDGYCPLCHPE